MQAAFGEEEEEVIPITAQEEKELRRAFDMLCEYQSKVHIKDQIRAIQADAYLKKVSALADTRISLDTKQLEREEEASSRSILDLQQQYADLEANPDRKISVADVHEMLKTLKVKVSKKKVQEMIWEVDDDLDGCLNWPEFRLMFTRNTMDKTGLEPSKMFNLVQFLIYDHNCNGKVSVDETMNMLYARYGRNKMETKLKELFGENMHETGREGGEISFAEFLQSVEKVQMQVFWGTTKGKIVGSKNKRAMSTTNLASSGLM